MSCPELPCLCGLQRVKVSAGVVSLWCCYFQKPNCDMCRLVKALPGAARAYARTGLPVPKPQKLLLAAHNPVSLQLTLAREPSSTVPRLSARELVHNPAPSHLTLALETFLHALTLVCSVAGMPCGTSQKCCKKNHSCQVVTTAKTDRRALLKKDTTKMKCECAIRGRSDIATRCHSSPDPHPILADERS